MNYIKGLNGLRGISILFVLNAHLGFIQLYPEISELRKRLWMCISGDTGVLIFFTLSGFLITKILLSERKKFNKINFKFFFIRRILRLFPPLIIFYTLIAILTKLHLIETSFIGFLFSIFYAFNFIPREFMSGEIEHTWSLAVEEQYYLIWPFVIHFFNKVHGAILIVILLTVCIAIHLMPEILVSQQYVLSRWFIPAVGPILVGSMFAWILQEDAYQNILRNNKILIWIGILCYLFPLYTPILELSFLFQAIGVSIVLSWILYNQTSRLTSLLNLKLISFIGTISYGLYVYQGLFLRTAPSDNLWIQKFPQNIVLTFIAAILSYYILEKPILKFKQKFTMRSNS